ncbi:NUDIX domain-containing protein [Candidatus Kaiserbacteria bacterium]|nr:NUDIX domain-containing protein [Candidatus Kaiserbacteria bacterium]
MKEILVLNPENASEDEVKTYRIRNAARAIVTDDVGLIALLHVSNHGYYKLPGGGFEEGEGTEAALRRECLEEIGCEIEVLNEIGSVVEHRKFKSLKQISYCYTARVKGEKGVSNFTEHEMKGGFALVWVTYDEALRFMAESSKTAKNIEGEKYIVPRDTRVLKEGKSLL